MKIFYLSVIFMLALFLCGCESDALAMAGRFYYRNTELNKDVSLKSVKFQLNRAKDQYADNMAKLALIYYISGLVCERENNYIEALINYEKALTYYSQFLDANLHIAYMYGYLGKEKEKREAYRKTLEILNQEFNYFETQNFPSNFIFFDPHMKGFVKQNFMENSYNHKFGQQLDNKVIINNLLELREKIKKELDSVDMQ